MCEVIGADVLISWQLHTLGHTCSGSCICTLDEDGDLDVNPDCPEKGHSGAVTSASFSPNGKRVVSGSIDQLVKIWDAETGAEVSSSVGMF